MSFIPFTILSASGAGAWGPCRLQMSMKIFVQETKRKLSELVESEKTKGMAIKELVREGEPTAEILKTIEQEKIDLLVMPAHKEGRLEDLLFDRSNDELVRKMPCSIMLVKKEAGKV